MGKAAEQRGVEEAVNRRGWLAQHSTIKEMGPTSSLGRVSTDNVQRAVCSGGLVVEVVVVRAGGGGPARHGASIRWASLLA